MKSIVSFLLILLFVCGCHRQTSRQSQIVHQITDRFSENVKKREGFYLSSYGGLWYPTIREIGLSYDVQRKVDLQQARRLLVQYVSELLKNVNESEELRPYLDEHPYSACGIHFTISFHDKHRHEFIDGSIAMISLFGFKDPDRTTVIYYTYDPQKYEWPRCHRETYEEAERIVRGGG